MLVEWTDTNLRNATFEGTAREVLRVQLNHRIHPMGELVFHPTARRGDPEWRVMYIGIGDGGAGEMRTIARPNPQRLDTLVGKILRIIPDPAEHVATSTLSENGRYRIPNDNPFVSKPGVKKEIWAYGLRNPHRLSWAADPARLATPSPDRRRRRPAHVGNGQHHPQGRELRVLAARGQSAAAARQRDRAACPPSTRSPCRSATR